MKLGVETMLLVILKRPDVHNSVEGVMNDVKNSGFRDKMQLIGMSAVRRMEMTPMNRTEALSRLVQPRLV